MPKHQRLPMGRCGLAYVRVVVFLVGFTVLLYFVSVYYLIPALQAAEQSTVTPLEKKVLSAHSRLILAFVLFILLAGLLLTFRVGRFFLPRPRQRNKPTVYPDAWAESARRVKLDDEDESA